MNQREALQKHIVTLLEGTKDFYVQKFDIELHAEVGETPTYKMSIEGVIPTAYIPKENGENR